MGDKNILIQNSELLKTEKNETESRQEEIVKLERIKALIEKEYNKNKESIKSSIKNNYTNQLGDSEINKNILEFKNILKDLNDHSTGEIDFGFMLSYGDSDEYMPAGVFYASGILDENGKPLPKLPEDLSKVIIEFSEFEYGNPAIQKENGDKVRIPLLVFKEMLEKHSQKNDNVMESILGESPKSFEMLCLFQEAFSSIIAENPEASEKIKFDGDSMEKSEIEFVSSNGEKRSNNYTIIPFRFGMNRFMERDNYEYKNDRGDGDYPNKHLHQISDIINEKSKEPESPSLDGKIVEPRPEIPSPGRHR